MGHGPKSADPLSLLRLLTTTSDNDVHARGLLQFYISAHLTSNFHLEATPRITLRAAHWAGNWPKVDALALSTSEMHGERRWLVTFRASYALRRRQIVGVGYKPGTEPCQGVAQCTYCSLCTFTSPRATEQSANTLAALLPASREPGRAKMYVVGLHLGGQHLTCSGPLRQSHHLTGGPHEHADWPTQ